MLPTVLIPLVGLAIDGSMLYIVQAKLAGAVDGAALGAGRLLGTTANTTEIAGEFLNANFPTGFWGTSNLQPNIQFVKTFIMNKITVSASVQAPLLFMRIFGYNYTTVSASAVATRKETRVELVIDRSGTMSGQLTAVKNLATQFTQSFISGYDEMGLVVYSNSGVVAYPTTRPYNTSPTSAGGPDSSFITTQTNGNMLTMISAMGTGGWTNMAEGLSLAYVELQKANHRDNDPTRLNAIVLFTDGFPNGFSMYANNLASNWLKPASQTNCKYNPATGVATTQMIGWAGGSDTGSGNAPGLYPLSLSDTTNTALYWVQYAGSPHPDQTGNLGTPVTSCNLGLNSGSPTLGDLNQIPALDLWGNSTNDSISTTAYKNSNHYSGASYASGTPNNVLNVGVASWNATDSAGARILSDTNLNVTIYVIAYTGSGGATDMYLLKRLANTKDSTNYNTSWQVGQYVEGTDSAGLAQAFQAVAASILRLAQ
jgi:Flp pilus assembly protein TadG